MVRGHPPPRRGEARGLSSWQVPFGGMAKVTGVVGPHSFRLLRRPSLLRPASRSRGLLRASCANAVGFPQQRGSMHSRLSTQSLIPALQCTGLLPRAALCTAKARAPPRAARLHAACCLCQSSSDAGSDSLARGVLLHASPSHLQSPTSPPLSFPRPRRCRSPRGHGSARARCWPRVSSDAPLSAPLRDPPRPP